jgi:hypothetical protein
LKGRERAVTPLDTFETASRRRSCSDVHEGEGGRVRGMDPLIVVLVNGDASEFQISEDGRASAATKQRR